MRWGFVALVLGANCSCQRDAAVTPPPSIGAAPVVADGTAIALTIPVVMSLPPPMRLDGSPAKVVGVDTGVDTAQIRIAAAGEKPAMGAVDMEIRYFPTQVSDRRALALLREAAGVEASVDELLGGQDSAVSVVELPRLRVVTIDTTKLGETPGNTFVAIANQRSPFGALLLARTGFLTFDWDELVVEWPLMD